MEDFFSIRKLFFLLLKGDKINILIINTSEKLMYEKLNQPNH